MTNLQENRILPAAGVRRSFSAESNTCQSISDADVDEDGSLNRQRRELSEGSGTTMPNSAILRCRKPIVIASFNSCTVRKEERRIELAHCADSCQVEILGIQEHRIVHEEEEIKFEKIEGYHLVTSSAWRNERQASQGGVGLLLSNRAKTALRSVESISKRILVAEFESNPVTTVIVVYSPTNVAPEEEVREFYDELTSVAASIPAHNFLAILGDFNARLGPEDARFTLHEKSNRNGQHLTDLMVENQLLAANTLFEKRRGKLWTYQDRTTGIKRQLDYILVRRKWRNSVLNAEAYSTFSSVGSDHRVVGAKLRLSLRVSRKPKRCLFDWEKFSERPDLQLEYSVHVQNRFFVLQSDDDTHTEEYDKFIAANDEAKERYVPRKPKRKLTKRSQNPLVQTARKHLEEQRAAHLRNPSEDSQHAVKQAQDKLFSTYDKIKEEELTAMAQAIEKEHGGKRYGAAWKVINAITGRRRAKEGLVKGETPDERKKTWFNHFSNLLGAPPEVDDPDEEIPAVFSNLNIPDGPFTVAEYQQVKSSLERGKGAGPDEIPPEVFKYCDVDDMVLAFCNRALLDGDKPDQWSHSNIVPIPKSGNLSKPANYRGISLSCIIAKIYNRLILNRIRKTIDPLLRNNQNGFRPGRNTIGQILALRRIIEEAKAHNLPAILTFIDFKKAFDSIHRGKMLKILKAYGIPPRLLKAIESMYKDVFAKVLTPDGETAWFQLLAGVLQGDTLAPFLFIIVLDYALRQAINGREVELGFTITPRRSSRYPAKAQTDFDFADDISLLSNEIHQAQKLLDLVEDQCKKTGLHLNTSKTKFIALNTPDDVMLTSAGEELERVEDFKYLGSYIMSTKQDIKVRKAKAWKALNGMKKIWTSNISRPVKLRLFLATVESVLLYGSETWTLTEALEKSLNGCYTRMLRAVFDVSWRDHMTNKQLYGNIPKVTDKVRSRRLQFAGHCYRHPELPANEVLLWQPIHGKRNRGRPAATFTTTLLNDTEAESVGELQNLLGERDRWRSISQARPRPPE